MTMEEGPGMTVEEGGPEQSDPGELVAAMVVQRDAVVLAGLQQLAGTAQGLVLGGEFLGPHGALPPLRLHARCRRFVVDDAIAHRASPQ